MSTQQGPVGPPGPAEVKLHIHWFHDAVGEGVNARIGQGLVFINIYRPLSFGPNHTKPWRIRINSHDLKGEFETREEAMEKVPKFLYHRLRAALLDLYNIPRDEQLNTRIEIRKGETRERY